MDKLSKDPVLPFVEISSATKDALVVNWIVHGSPQRTVTGYRIGYQAVGSSVVQFVHSLSPVPTLYEITNLHENTVYNVCVEALTAANASSAESEEDRGRPPLLRWGTVCVTGATNAESVSVLLGSGVGAFLAIAVVVFFVVLAKWQHSHRKRRRKQNITGEYHLDDRCGGDPDHDDLSAIIDRRGSSSLDSGARLASTPSLVFDLVDDPSSMFVAELGLGDGQRYGLLLPLARASELLPLVVDESAGSAFDLLSPGTGAADQVSGRRRRLQKYKTIDYGNEYEAEKQLNGDVLLYAEHPDSYFSHIQFEPERLITDGYANENMDCTWLYRTRSLSI